MKLFILILCLFLVSCSSLEGPYQVTNVIDGDTIDLDNGMRIRFAGVNTPELKKDVCYAYEAKAFIEENLLGEYIYVEKDNYNKDKYYRYLRYIYYRDLNINFILVKEGFAKVYDKYKRSTKHYSELKELEEEAKLAKKGIWSCEKSLEGETEIIDARIIKLS